MDFSGDPVLLVNKNLDKSAVAASPLFRSLVCPQVMRKSSPASFVLRNTPIGTTTKTGEPAGSASPKRFRASARFGSKTPENFDDWVDSAVASFARRQGLFGHFAAIWEGE